MSNVAIQKPINATMTISKAGIDHISKDEGFSAMPYDDIAGNCTVGIGILLSYSPCTEKQKKTRYDLAKLNATFHDRLEEAQKYVRFYVRETELGQAQFDSLTSFVFNTGVGNARGVLALANKGEHKLVAEEMNRFVYITQKSKDGKPSKKQYSNGLANRRKREIVPFQAQP
ncbi:GH24 family phage-related lysozyme (muramidase) [Limnobacter thiooxidans]|mgnify:FL=1|nr:lysozyme [Limnobacter sp.]MCZ8016342.1 lysozyme [Limnobacter sp.]RZS39796.1 GH24 family phage-related lysozyme (muramidase) [Limnobacter thiooxidans]